MSAPDFDFLIEPEHIEHAEHNEFAHTGPSIKEAVKMTPRKFATSVLEVFNRLGGASWLMTQAQADPRAFIELLKKLLPKSIQLDDLPGLRINLIDQFGNEVQIDTGAPPDAAAGAERARSGQLPMAQKIATGGSPTSPGLISSPSQEKSSINIKDIFE